MQSPQHSKCDCWQINEDGGDDGGEWSWYCCCASFCVIPLKSNGIHCRELAKINFKLKDAIDLLKKTKYF